MFVLAAAHVKRENAAASAALARKRRGTCRGVCTKFARFRS